MNSNDKIPSIKEVVQQLRAEGRLDEEKWNAFRFRILYVNYTLLAIAYIVLLGATIKSIELEMWWTIPFFGVLLPIMISVAMLKHIQEVGKILYCSNLGMIAKGKITALKRMSASGPRNTHIMIHYSFHTTFDKEIKSKIKIPRQQVSAYSSLQVGDEIEVLYTGKNAENSCIKIQPFVDRYRINKGDKYNSNIGGLTYAK